MEHTVTTKQVSGAVQIIGAVAEAIREARSIPAGPLYAMLMGRMSFESFGRIITILENAGLVSEKNHMLTWVGPEVK